MRNVTCHALIELYRQAPFVFLTGDLGFMALEPLRDVMKDRFINAGVAEQNMVAVAAGMASEGLQCWLYSISPFLYARPFEQIRNDVCMHNADVKLIGNGGGYGYGSMGATHHALEDYGALLTLQNMRAYIPAFSADIPQIVPKMAQSQGPAYLRLGLCEKPPLFELPVYAPWRNVLPGAGPVFLIVGPPAGGFIRALQPREPEDRPDVWVLSELPFARDIPEAFREAIGRSQHLCIVEEHVLQGSAGQMVAHRLMTQRVAVRRFEHYYARGYPSGTCGSQLYHRRECGFDVQTVLERSGVRP
jgi:transketolase